MSSAADYNRLVEAQWEPLHKAYQLAAPSAQEAVTGARILYIQFFRKLWKETQGYDAKIRKVRAVNGRKRSKVRAYSVEVNPRHGWPHIIHDLSHSFHGRIWSARPGHDHSHLILERDMVKYAIENGFHLGRLKRDPKPTKPKAPKPSLTERREAKARKMLDKAERDFDKAKKRVRKWKKKVGYYFGLKCKAAKKAALKDCKPAMQNEQDSAALDHASIAAPV